MKTNKILLNLAICLGTTAFLFSGCSQKSKQTETTSVTQTEEHSGHDMDMAAEGSNKMMDLMHQNMSKMQEMEMTGDVDHDFAMMMAIHHQGAIAMSEEEVNNGTDPMLKEMANKTIASSKTDIQKLSSFTSNHQPMAGDASKSMKLMQPMKDMMGQMEHGMQGTTDHHFAKMMSMHHQQGIDMSKVQVAEGKTPAMKQMAQKIIDEQEKDKQKLDNWLQEHPQQK